MKQRARSSQPSFHESTLRPKQAKALVVISHSFFTFTSVPDVIRAVKEVTGASEHPAMRGSSATVVCARQGAVFDQALAMTRQGGTVVLAGFVPRTEFDPAILLMKQLTVTGIMAGRFGQNRINGELAVYTLAHKQIDPKPIISAEIRFAESQSAIDATYSGEQLARVCS